MEKGVFQGKTHKIRIRKPFLLPKKEKIVCPFCGNTEEFYEIVENATFYIYYMQTEMGTLEPLEEEAEVLGPVRFYCGVCHSDITHLKK
ncbi:MAG: hypothetical protein ACP5QC_01220 [Caldimicrobium sp.]|jgi:hypothetical protein|uniref:Uncharacterized protein n=1 Tax=Caldimicrobium thiodismutans TaxID=1653476 RepID=A0A2N7PK83_9BACT|nr:MAG: hypothetical protein C0197_02460 [Caldimicrobium thiodismutans]